MAETNSLLNCRIPQGVPGVRIPPSPRRKKTMVASSFFSGYGAVRLAHLLWEQGVEGSNPFAPTVERKKESVTPFFVLYLPFPSINDLLQFIPVTRGFPDGVNELAVVTRRLVTPALEITIFVNTLHHLVVIFHNQVFR